MITLKVKLYQDSAGALHAEFIDGINSVSQNNAGKNVVEVMVDGFELQTDEILQIAYATSLNENDPETESIGFNFMEKSYERNSWLAEIEPLVLDRRGVWYLGLRVVTQIDGVIQTVSNETDMLEFTVNATIQDKNGNYPIKGDVSALFQTAVESVEQSKKIANETATLVAKTVAESVAYKKLTPVIQVTNEQLGATLELFVNENTYVLTARLRAKNAAILAEQIVDLPLEEMIVDAYQNEGGNLVIVLKNGQERTIELGALIKGLVSSDEKGQPNGVASLNEDGKVPDSQLPPLEYLPLTGGTVSGCVTASTFISGSGEDETIYADGSISFGGNDFVFPDESGTIALQEPIDTQIELLKQAITQSGIMYAADNTALWNERVTADGLNVLDGSTAVLKKVVGNTVAYDKDENGLNGKLASASFGGIESTNADGTETSTLAFPKTETPLGVTIDFETQKVTDYGYTVTLTGGEYWSFIGYRNGESLSLYTLVLPTTETRNQNAVITDGILDNDDYYASNSWWIGVNSKNLYWINIINVLELNKNWSDKLNPTTEERNQAIADFKAYLAQRYADGNPVTIRYVSATLQSETDFTADNEYTAYKSGTESVLQNDGAEYGANNELTINYVYITEAQE